MFLQLLFCVEPLSAFQTPDLVCFWLVVAPAARVLFVLLEVLLTEEFSQTGPAVDAPGLTFVAAVQLGQAEVVVASQTGVRQQPQVAEAVLQEGGLLGKGQTAVRAFEEAAAFPPLMAHEGLRGGKTASTRFTFNTRGGGVQLDVLFARLQRGKYVFA